VTKSSAESSSYAALGASSAKAGVLKAIGEGSTSRYFATPCADPLGDPQQAFFLHADGAGTKSILAYLLYKESGNPSWFGSLAIDSMVMNLDDLACAGATEGLVLSNTIGRNRSLIPDDCIAAVIHGYQAYADALRDAGLNITLAGGETADVGDLVRTIIVDSTLSARVPRSSLVDAYRATPGDLIIGFSSCGQSRLESSPNSSIGSNGLTLARNALLSSYHRERYPEVSDPAIPANLAYRGPFKIDQSVPELGTTVGEALLSPTRAYTPMIKRLLAELFDSIHSLVHCTGGGQTKIRRFGKNVRFEKEDLFPVPPIFELIQRHGGVPWEEMYAVFNMGHRLEACVDPSAASEVIDLASQFGIAAKVIGRVTFKDGGNEVLIESPHGRFVYGD
jgi:phosphoribosylformylglycinamidine cyclo-ligase